MNPIPPVRRVVMFKHGIAFFERAGKADGPFELSFHKDEMNDVLKSLTAWVEAGDARIGEIAFDKPEDPETRLVERGLKFEPEQGLRGLLAAFRGQRIAVTHGGVRLEGEILGVEASRGEGGAERFTLVLRATQGGVEMVDLSRVTGMEFPDPAVQADLALLLDRSRATRAGTTRAVRVAVHGKADDLRVSYILPAPIWRVTYRVACAGAEATLMAWAIVHNPSDSDLHEVSLTLTTGRPVSFQIDLYNPRNVTRALLEEEVPMPGTGARVSGRTLRKMAAAPVAAASFAMDESEMDSRSALFGGSVPSVAEGADRGEFFEYRITNPVSLQRGGSALVPLLSAPLEAKRQRIWQPGQGANPDIVLTFPNHSGAVLEEGAGVIYEDEVYAGEAMFPYAARGAAVKLVFAKDMSVRCVGRRGNSASVGALRLAQGFLVEELRLEERWEFSAENDHGDEVEVLIELPRQAGRSADPAYAQPVSTSLTHNTYSITVPAHGKHTIEVIERSLGAKNYKLGDFSHLDLRRWLEGKYLDVRTMGMLKGLMQLRDNIEQSQQQIVKRTEERDEIHARQKNLAEQLTVLKESGAEGKLRLRYVGELADAQDRVNAVDAEVRQLNDAVKSLHEQFTRNVNELTA